MCSFYLLTPVQAQTHLLLSVRVRLVNLSRPSRPIAAVSLKKRQGFRVCILAATKLNFACAPLRQTSTVLTILSARLKASYYPCAVSRAKPRAISALRGKFTNIKPCFGLNAGRALSTRFLARKRRLKIAKQKSPKQPQKLQS